MPLFLGSYWRMHTAKTGEQAQEEKKGRFQKWGLEHRKYSEGMSQRQDEEWPKRTAESQGQQAAGLDANKRMEEKWTWGVWTETTVDGWVAEMVST